MLRAVKVYGRLAKFLGQRTFLADVSSAAEAVRFLLANFPQLEGHMAEQHYKVCIGSDAITLDELHYPAGRDEIRIIPVLAGAGATGRIIAGIALVALAIAVPGLGGGVAATVFGTAFSSLSLAIGGVGLSLVLGGVAELLTPTPKLNTKKESDPRESYSFSGVQNTSRQGTSVPILFGEVVTGSVVISAAIDIEQR